MISDLHLATCAHGGQRIVKRRRSRELRKGGKRTKSTNAGQYFFSAYKRTAQSKENISAPCSRKQKMPGQLRNDRGEDKALVEVAPALRDRIAAASSTELPRKRLVQHNAQNFSRLIRTAFKNLGRLQTHKGALIYVAWFECNALCNAP